MFKPKPLNFEKLDEIKRELPPLPKIAYPYFNQGDQSIILEGDKDNVLVVTSYKVAKNIELVRKKFRETTSECELAIPRLVGVDLNVGELLDPASPKVALEPYKASFKRCHAQICTKNIVYTLPRYNGTLENIEAMPFSMINVGVMENQLKRALSLIHQAGLAHNDIAKRNIFFSGQYPNYRFHIGDFGTATVKSQPKAAKDLEKLEKLVKDIRSKISDKLSFIKETANDFLPRYNQRKSSIRSCRYKSTSSSSNPKKISKVSRTRPSFKNFI